MRSSRLGLPSVHLQQFNNDYDNNDGSDDNGVSIDLVP